MTRSYYCPSQDEDPESSRKGAKQRDDLRWVVPQPCDGMVSSRRVSIAECRRRDAPTHLTAGSLLSGSGIYSNREEGFDVSRFHCLMERHSNLQNENSRPVMGGCSNDFVRKRLLLLLHGFRLRCFFNGLLSFGHRYVFLCSFVERGISRSRMRCGA